MFAAANALTCSSYITDSALAKHGVDSWCCTIPQHRALERSRADESSSERKLECLLDSGTLSRTCVARLHSEHATCGSCARSAAATTSETQVAMPKLPTAAISHTAGHQRYLLTSLFCSTLSALAVASDRRGSERDQIDAQ